MNTLLSTRCRRYTCPFCHTVRVVLMDQPVESCARCGEYLGELPWLLDDINTYLRDIPQDQPPCPGDHTSRPFLLWFAAVALFVFHLLLWLFF